MSASGILYPYWENAARYTEDMMALLVVLAVLAAIVPLVFLGIFYSKNDTAFEYAG